MPCVKFGWYLISLKYAVFNINNGSIIMLVIWFKFQWSKQCNDLLLWPSNNGFWTVSQLCIDGGGGG